MDLRALREEYERERLGARWLELVGRVCRSETRRYPPEIYSATGSWDDGIDDLVQDVVVNALLRDHQLEYVMDVAVNLVHVERLLSKQVRHVLARGRRRTVVDQLLKRAVREFEDEAFASIGDGTARRWHLREGPFQQQPGGHRRAVAIVRSAARVPSTVVDRERAPQVFTTRTLRALLLEVLAEHGPASRREISEILSDGLTPLLPGALVTEERPEASGRSQSRPEDELVISTTVDAIVDEADAEGRAILRLKLLGHSDVDVAAELGVSRPTAAGRKHLAFEHVKTHLNGVPASLHDAVLDALSVRLTLPLAEGTADA